MSTINIVDWINSLSESELKDQLVLAIDGQTPTKGNSADKASLSGGSDANFAAMPQVSGNPIVESGSNSDGQWVRWADGTQIVFRIITSSEVESTSTGFSNTRFDFPVNFIERPIPISQSGDAEIFVLRSFATGPDSYETRDNFFFACRNTIRWNARVRSSIGSATPQVISAFGRWY